MRDALDNEDAKRAENTRIAVEKHLENLKGWMLSRLVKRLDGFPGMYFDVGSKIAVHVDVNFDKSVSVHFGFWDPRPYHASRLHSSNPTIEHWSITSSDNDQERAQSVQRILVELEPVIAIFIKNMNNEISDEIK